MKDTPHIVLVANTESGSSRGLDPVREVFGQAGYRIIELVSDDTTALVRFARTYVHVDGRDAAALAVAGGDGTLSAMLPVLLDSRVPLLALPAGTGNDFARQMALPTDPAEAARLLSTGRLTHIDIGTVRVAEGTAEEDHPFLNAVQIGAGVKIMQQTTPQQKRNLGPLAYLLSTLRVYDPDSSFDFSLFCTAAPRPHAGQDDPPAPLHSTALAITVANGRGFGGGVAISPTGTNRDQTLRYMAVRSATLIEHIAQLSDYLDGTVTNSELVHAGACSTIRITPTPPQPVSADGEPVGTTPVHIRLHPRRLAVFVPAISPGCEAGLDDVTSQLIEVTRLVEDLKNTTPDSQATLLFSSLQAHEDKLFAALRAHGLLPKDGDPDVVLLEEARAWLAGLFEDHAQRTRLRQRLLDLQNDAEKLATTDCLPDDVSAQLARLITTLRMSVRGQ